MSESPPFIAHSDTSQQAARSIVSKAATMRAQVLAELRNSGPSTDEELQLVLGMNPSTQRPRRIELVAEGLVKDSGLTKLTKSGRSAVIWEVVK